MRRRYKLTARTPDSAISRHHFSHLEQIANFLSVFDPHGICSIRVWDNQESEEVDMRQIIQLAEWAEDYIAQKQDEHREEKSNWLKEGF